MHNLASQAITRFKKFLKKKEGPGGESKNFLQKGFAFSPGILF